MFQTVIIGAGVAGLAAGRELLRRGEQPLVLEARDRIGGRIFTLRDCLSALPVELGAEMVHGLHPVLWDVLREGLAVPVEMQGVHLTRDADGLHPMEFFDKVERVFERMAKAKEQSFESFINSIKAPPDVKQAATGFVEGFNAARKEDVSVAWLNQESGDERTFRIVNGYDTVPGCLSRGLDVRLSTVVKRIQWTKGKVTVETDRGEFKAAKVIVAVPFSLLRTKAIEIDPEPPSLRAAREAIATGDAIRITFRFREPAWEKHPDLSFLHSDEAFPVWWTPFPVRVPMITGWAAGPKADALSGLSREDLVRAALQSLRAILGDDFDPPESAHFHDWRADPFSHGAYSYVRVNGLPAQAALSRPVKGTLCFAGEALGTSGQTGTVHGAIASGIHAANFR